MNLDYYYSYLEVDLEVIRNNILKIKKHIGPNHGIIPVVKGNAYGMGTEEIVKLLIEDFNITIIGNAQVYESIKIRKAGYKDVDILLMGAVPRHIISYAVDYNLQIPLFEKESAKLLSKCIREQGKGSIKAHIKLETGLNRIGVRPGEELEELLDCIIKLGNIEIDGVYAHFSTATAYNSDFAKEQFRRFMYGVGQIQTKGIHPRYISTCNTGGTVWFKEAYCSHVRIGSLYLGYCTMDDYSNPLGVKEAASWRAFITSIHSVDAGEPIGYKRHYIPDKPTTVATISVGYGDGLFRIMTANHGPVLVGGVKTHYIDSCMDQTLIDVTGISCMVGDEVTIFGYNKNGDLLSTFELERFSGLGILTHLCTVGDRVKRIYKNR